MSTPHVLNASYIRPLIISWLIWIIVHAGVLYWLSMDPVHAIADSVVFNFILIDCSILQLFIMQYYFPKKDRFSFVIINALGIALTSTALSTFFLRLIFHNDAAYIDFLQTAFPVKLGVSLLLAACMTMINILVYTIKDEQIGIQRKHEAEQMTKEAELFQLRSQLQPHFLFNSLNSISALAGSKPDQARTMIQQLSDFLRGTIRKDTAQLITLEEELKHLRLYLEIEKVRFGHRLQTDIQCPDNCHQLQIPSLLLQPVLENAIKFGLYDTLDNVLISIQAKEEKPYLFITITNPYDKDTQRVKGTGFGLSAVQRRLFLLYSRNDLLITSKTENTFTTTLIIPQAV